MGTNFPGQKLGCPFSYNVRVFIMIKMEQKWHTFKGISIPPSKSHVDFPAVKASLKNFLKPRPSLISLIRLNFSEKFSSGLKSLQIDFQDFVTF